MAYMLLANGQALLCGHTVDAALDIEDGIDPPHRLDGERRIACSRQRGRTCGGHAPSRLPRLTGPGRSAAA